MYNKAITRLDSVFVIYRIIEVSVRVISLSLRFRLINSKVKFKSILLQVAVVISQAPSMNSVLSAGELGT